LSFVCRYSINGKESTFSRQIAAITYRSSNNATKQTTIHIYKLNTSFDKQHPIISIKGQSAKNKDTLAIIDIFALTITLPLKLETFYVHQLIARKLPKQSYVELSMSTNFRRLKQKKCRFFFFDFINQPGLSFEFTCSSCPKSSLELCNDFMAEIFSRVCLQHNAQRKCQKKTQFKIIIIILLLRRENRGKKSMNNRIKQMVTEDA
jgi:hypothetical protein